MPSIGLVGCCDEPLAACYEIIAVIDDVFAGGNTLTSAHHLLMHELQRRATLFVDGLRKHFYNHQETTQLCRLKAVYICECK